MCLHQRMPNVSTITRKNTVQRRNGLNFTAAAFTLTHQFIPCKICWLYKAHGWFFVILFICQIDIGCFLINLCLKETGLGSPIRSYCKKVEDWSSHGWWHSQWQSCWCYPFGTLVNSGVWCGIWNFFAKVTQQPMAHKFWTNMISYGVSLMEDDWHFLLNKICEHDIEDWSISDIILLVVREYIYTSTVIFHSIDG